MCFVLFCFVLSEKEKSEKEITFGDNAFFFLRRLCCIIGLSSSDQLLGLLILTLQMALLGWCHGALVSSFAWSPPADGGLAVQIGGELTDPHPPHSCTQHSAYSHGHGLAVCLQTGLPLEKGGWWRKRKASVE